MPHKVLKNRLIELKEYLQFPLLQEKIYLIHRIKSVFNTCSRRVVYYWTRTELLVKNASFLLKIAFFIAEAKDRILWTILMHGFYLCE